MYRKPIFLSSLLVVAAMCSSLRADIPCQDIRRFQARCTNAGKIQARLILSDNSHHGEPVTFALDGEQITRIVNGDRVTFARGGQGATGDREIALANPAGCRLPIIVDCGGNEECPPGVTCEPVVPGEPSDIGEWSMEPGISPVMVVHAAMLHTGKVLLFAGELEGYVLPHDSATWDPITNEFNHHVNAYVDDLFCAGHAQLPDGRVIVVGGSASPGQGIRGTNIFDPITETWSEGADMSFGRWYPTALTEPDGNILVFSGWVPPIVDEVERYNPTTDTWTTLPATANRDWEIYPSMHLLPDGNVVYTGTRWSGGTSWGNPPATHVLNRTTNTWSSVANHIIGNRIEGFSVQMPDLWKVMVIGGECNGPNTQTSVEMMDLSAGSPTWQAKASTNFPRKNVNGVILPDGDIALVTGINGYKWSPSGETYETEIWDNDTETWKEMDSMSVVGQYHSISLLLPDGRVLKGGGQDAGPLIYDLETFSPPYLFRGARPVIDGAPTSVGYNQGFDIDTADACDVDRVTMVRLSTITHHTNTDQRFLELTFDRTDKSTLSATSPANANVAPPGYYMLFILNECGTPSVAKMVRVG